MLPETTCPTHGATMAPRDPTTMSDEQTWCGQWFDCTQCGLSVLIPSAELKEQNRILTLPLLLGYRVDWVSDEPGVTGYRLHGPRVTYYLVRYRERHRHLYAINTRGHRASIKGHYTFTDESGRLEVKT